MDLTCAYDVADRSSCGGPALPVSIRNPHPPEDASRPTATQDFLLDVLDQGGQVVVQIEVVPGNSRIANSEVVRADHGATFS